MKKKTKIIITAVVAAACVILAFVLIRMSNNDSSDTQFEAIDCGDGIELKSISSYDGPFLEDGSDESVSGVMQATVSNNGESDIEFAYLRVTDEEGNEYTFKISCLLHGETMTVLEENRAEYKSDMGFETAELENVAEFTSVPDLHSDIFALLLNGNTVTVINDDEVAHSNICISYKNYDGDTALGGITYRITIPYLEAGESAEISTAHFDESTSRCIFITYD